MVYSVVFDSGAETVVSNTELSRLEAVLRKILPWWNTQSHTYTIPNVIYPNPQAFKRRGAAAAERIGHQFCSGCFVVRPTTAHIITARNVGGTLPHRLLWALPESTVIACVAECAVIVFKTYGEQQHMVRCDMRPGSDDLKALQRIPAGRRLPRRPLPALYGLALLQCEAASAWLEEETVTLFGDDAVVRSESAVISWLAGMYCSHITPSRYRPLLHESLQLSATLKTHCGWLDIGIGVGDV